MSTYAVYLTLILAAALPLHPAIAGGKNVAVIDAEDVSPPPSIGKHWCNFLIQNGYPCTLFPREGPTGPLDPFDVVIDISFDWTDPTGSLADLMRAGKTVITVNLAPGALGIQFDPIVQAWIGANGCCGGSDRLVTTVTDPILGDIPPGTELMNCSTAVCGAVHDTSGHYYTKILATYVDHPDPQPVGIMRNFWENGVSVYLPGFMSDEIVLNAVEARPPTIPVMNTWGFLILALALGVAGPLILRRVARRASFIVLIGAVVALDPFTVKAQVNSTKAGGVTHLWLGDSEPFHSTESTVVNLRSVAIPNSAGLVALWEEVDSNGVSRPFQATSFDGAKVSDVGPTSYDLELKYARFDSRLVCLGGFPL